jgi:hypothetical protein
MKQSRKDSLESGIEFISMLSVAIKIRQITALRLWALHATFLLFPRWLKKGSLDPARSIAQELSRFPRPMP